jgi:iron complex outermembrane recepter protein
MSSPTVTRYRLCHTLLVTAVWAALISPVCAQVSVDASQNPAAGSLEEIVVTAQKREQNIQDVGVAVTVIGEQGLAVLGHRDISALTAQVPSLQVNQYNPYQTIFNIRGVSQNDVSDGQEAPIAFYSDEVYVAALGAIAARVSTSSVSKSCAGLRARFSAGMRRAASFR